MPLNLNLLVIDDEAEIAEYIREVLEAERFSVRVAASADEGLQFLRKEKFDVVISDIHMPGKSGIRMLEEACGFLSEVPPFLFVSGNADPAVIERASKLGAVDVLQKPFQERDLLAAVLRMNSRSSDKISDIMAMIHAISGMTLGSEKRVLVETRLLRRTRHLNLDTIDQYYEYFKKHREAEVNELISLITTHTTQFFREPPHFDFLFNEVFPKFIHQGQSVYKIWSAACSSGEEVYSIAISWMEFLRSKSVPLATAPRLIVTGTDIDHNVIATAEKGIFPKQSLDQINRNIVSRYFDFGTGALAGVARVKDFVHDLCQFSQMNLIGKVYPKETFDVIFLRNVLIYFKPEIVKQIVQNLAKNLDRSGYLILGHSESVVDLNLPLEICGNSVYRCKGNSEGRLLSKEQPASVASRREKKTRVFIIDDSATIRKMLKNILSGHPKIEVVGDAESPLKLARPLLARDVDVVTLDIHMPGQDGIAYLKSIQGIQHPPVVMISSVAIEDGVDYLRCLELGATDYLEKPQSQNLLSDSENICRVILAAADKPTARSFGRESAITTPSTLVPMYKSGKDRRDLMLIGASTGGVEALKVVLESFPEETPPILIVQHIPEKFSKTLADRLNQCCRIRVKEAEDNERIEGNCAYIAAGGRQMAVISIGSVLKIAINDDPAVNRHRPSVDYLFNSAVPLLKNYQISAAILTGMGADGANGLLALKNSGAHTIAQNEESSIVYGMPGVAVELGAAIEVLPLQSIAYHLFKPFKKAMRVA